MPVAKKTCIVGAGGFGSETLACYYDSLRSRNMPTTDAAVFMVDDEYFDQAFILGVPVVKSSEFDPAIYRVTVAIGDPSTRNQIVNQLPAETEYRSIVHPNVVMSDWVSLGKGSVVAAGCIMTTNISLGSHCHLNLTTTIGHDSEIDDFFTSAPGVNISGNCHFGQRVYLGSNVSVREKVSICSDVTVGMGAIVLKDITEPGVYIGSPLRKLEK